MSNGTSEEARLREAIAALPPDSVVARIEACVDKAMRGVVDADVKPYDGVMLGTGVGVTDGPTPKGPMFRFDRARATRSDAAYLALLDAFDVYARALGYAADGLDFQGQAAESREVLRRIGQLARAVPDIEKLSGLSG